VGSQQGCPQLISPSLGFSMGAAMGEVSVMWSTKIVGGLGMEGRSSLALYQG
jgi:hypothetical protein